MTQNIIFWSLPFMVTFLIDFYILFQSQKLRIFFSEINADSFFSFRVHEGIHFYHTFIKTKLKAVQNIQ